MYSRSEGIPVDSGPMDGSNYSSSSGVPLDSGPMGGGMYSSSSGIPLDSGPTGGYGGGYSSSSGIPLDSGPIGGYGGGYSSSPGFAFDSGPIGGGYSSSTGIPLDSGPIGGGMYPSPTGMPLPPPSYHPSGTSFPGDPYASNNVVITSQPMMSHPTPNMTCSDGIPLASGVAACPVCRNGTPEHACCGLCCCCGTRTCNNCGAEFE